MEPTTNPREQDLAYKIDRKQFEREIADFVGQIDPMPTVGDLLALKANAEAQLRYYTDAVGNADAEDLPWLNEKMAYYTALRDKAANEIEARGGIPEPIEPPAPPTPQPTVALKRQRGPRAKFEDAMRVAECVRRIAPDGDWRAKVNSFDLQEALDMDRIPIPKTWRKKGCHSWSDQDDHELVRKAIENRLNLAARRK